MYTLLSGLYRHLTQKDDYFILILGLDNAGKTTFLESAKTKFTAEYKGINPNKITSTVGLNIGKIDVKGIRLNFWDLGGQEELQALWDKYYSECHGIIYTVDSNDRARVQESKRSFDTMISNPNLKGVPLLLIANKQDIEECMGVREVKPIFQDNAESIGKRDCMVLPTSGLTGDGVEEGIDWLVGCVKRNDVIRPPASNDGDWNISTQISNPSYYNDTAFLLNFVEKEYTPNIPTKTLDRREYVIFTIGFCRETPQHVILNNALYFLLALICYYCVMTTTLTFEYNYFIVYWQYWQNCFH